MFSRKVGYTFLLILAIVIGLCVIGASIYSRKYNTLSKYYIPALCFSYNMTNSNILWLILNEDKLNTTISQDHNSCKGLLCEDIRVKEFYPCWITNCYWNDIYHLDYCDRDFPIEFFDPTILDITLIISFSIILFFCIALAIPVVLKLIDSSQWALYQYHPVPQEDGMHISSSLEGLYENPEEGIVSNLSSESLHGIPQDFSQNLSH